MTKVTSQVLQEYLYLQIKLIVKKSTDTHHLQILNTACS